MDKQLIHQYIKKQASSASEDEQNPWRFLQMLNDTRSFEVFDYMVRWHLKDYEKEVKKPYDHSDAFEVSWHAGLERDVKVFGNIVRWLDEQKEGEGNGRRDGQSQVL